MKLPEVLTGYASRFPCVCQKGIELDGLACVGFGSGVVLEVDLGDGSEKIWPCEIGLGPDYLVEVLNRQHVVLEIESILPDSNHLVGVDLSLCY